MIDVICSWWGRGGPGIAAGALGGICIAIYVLAIGRLSWIDAHEHLLPRRIVRPLYPVLGGGLFVAAWCADEADRMITSFLGALVTGGVYAAMRLLSPRSVGRGDIRLAPLLGGVSGFVSVPHAVAGVVLTFCACGLWALFLLILRRTEPHGHVALGPWMGGCSAAAWLALPESMV